MQVKGDKQINLWKILNKDLRIPKKSEILVSYDIIIICNVGSTKKKILNTFLSASIVINEFLNFALRYS